MRYANWFGPPLLVLLARRLPLDRQAQPPQGRCPYETLPDACSSPSSCCSAFICLCRSADSAKVKADRPFVEVDSAKVNSLRIQAPDEVVELTKNGEEWKLAQPVPYAAAGKTVDAAVGKISSHETADV